MKSDGKLIVKNTLFLYLRLLLVVGVSLYTSRVVLQVLGVDDYGIYNVVGGFVAMLAYLRNAFVGATQRYIAYTLGEGDLGKLKKVFSTSITVHILLCALILIIAESFGLWFVNSKLVIEPERIYAANWVYQCSLATLLFSLLTVPYNSSIVAHEHMHIFAYVSVVEAIMKLGIVYLLLMSPFDQLIYYAILHLGISVVVWIFYRLYCIRKFEECKYKIGIDRPLFKDMFAYSGWTLIGSLGFSFKDQLSNIIMNMFLGTAINAARGIAAQVNSIIMSFSENLFTAVAPQITKQYAAGNIQESQKLVYAGARFTFYLMMIFTIPIITNADYILKLWLGTVPEYTKEFLIITLLSSIVYTLTKPLTTAIQATGRIKVFQIGVSLIMLLELPIAWVLLDNGFPPHYAMIPAIITNYLAIIFRLWNLHSMVPTYQYRYFLINICFSCSLLYIFTYIICECIKTQFSDNLWQILCNVALSVLTIVMLIYALGLNKSERKYVLNVINRKITKN